MRIALVIASLVLAAQAANACPPQLPAGPMAAPTCGNATCWHGSIAVAFVAAADQPRLVATIDNAGFGGSDWPGHSMGVLITGSSVRYVGPLAGMTSDALRGTASVGTLDDAVDLATAELERIDDHKRVIYIVGEIGIEKFLDFAQRARRSKIDVYVWPEPTTYRKGQYDYVTQVLKKPVPAPHDPPRWPAVALLLAAAALSRRITA